MLSSSAPGAIHEDEQQKSKLLSNHSVNSSIESVLSEKQRISKDSAMEDENENSHSLSGYTDSTEQSAAVNFDMSNRVC